MGAAGRAIAVFVLVLLGTSLLPAQDTFEDLAARAASARDSNDAKTAIALYQAALRLKPEWKQGLWMSGSLLYEAEQYKDAAEALRRLVALAPEAGPGWGILGLCEYETKDFAPAFEHIERAISLGIGEQQQMLLVLKFHRAALLTKFGRFDAAVDSYNGFFGGEVSDHQVLIGLGLLSLRRALAPVEVAEAQKDLFLSAGKAYAAFLGNDRGKAGQEYEELVARYPKDPDVRYAYGYFLFGTDPDLAIAQWQRTLAMEPAHAGANAMLAWAFSLRGEREKALGYAGAALKKDPNQAIAQIVMGRMLVESGKAEAGLTHLEQAAVLQPGNLEAHLALATAYSQAGRKADAQRERQLCLQKQAERSIAQQ